MTAAESCDAVLTAAALAIPEAAFARAAAPLVPTALVEEVKSASAGTCPSFETDGRWKRVGKGALLCALRQTRSELWGEVASDRFAKPSADRPKPTTRIGRVSDDQISIRRRLCFDHGQHRIPAACVRAG
jgi:hypothetical protein